jgi:hypothetical protein
LPGGGRKRQKPIKEISCPRCGTRAIFAERQPYCPNCRWNVELTRRALKPTLIDSIWLKIWFAFVMYVVKAPWPFLVFAAAVVLYGYIQRFRALRKLPDQVTEPPAASPVPPVRPELRFEWKRKGNDYSRVMIFVFPALTIGGVISLLFTLQSLRVGTFEWKRLSDLILPGVFPARRWSGVMGCLARRI